MAIWGGKISLADAIVLWVRGLADLRLPAKPPLPSNSGALPHEFGYAFGDHDGRHVGIGADDLRHDRGIGDPQAVHSVDAAFRIDDGERIICSANRAGRTGMKARATRSEDFIVRHR